MTAPIQPIETPAMLEIERKSGFVVYFTLPSPSRRGDGGEVGEGYTLTAGCECPASECTLQACPSPHDRAGELTVIHTCARHGTYRSIAYLVDTAPRTRRARAVFAWAEDNARRKVAASHTPTWGYSGRNA